MSGQCQKSLAIAFIRKLRREITASHSKESKTVFFEN